MRNTINIDEELKIGETYASSDYASMMEFTKYDGELYHFDEYDYNEQTQEFDRFACERILTKREVIKNVII